MSGYLLDANVLITPHKQYYPFDFAPSFWKQLANVLRRKNATILRVVSNEILDKMNDSLSEWFKGIKEDIKIPSVKRNQKVHDNYALVLQYIQTCGFYTNTALLNWARDGVADPWLIATAMNNGYKIVTNEQPSGNLSRKNLQNNPKIPDVAKQFKVQCISLFDFMRAMNFKM